MSIAKTHISLIILVFTVLTLFFFIFNSNIKSIAAINKPVEKQVKEISAGDIYTPTLGGIANCAPFEGDTYVKLLLSTTECLTADDAGNLTAQQDIGSDYQFWRVVKRSMHGVTIYSFQNKENGQYVGVDGSSDGNGVRIKTYNWTDDGFAQSFCLFQKNDRYLLRPIYSASSVITVMEDGTVKLWDVGQFEDNKSFCVSRVDLAGNFPVNIGDYFTATIYNDRTHKYISTSGDNVVADSIAYNWIFIRHTDGTYTVTSASEGMAIDIPCMNFTVDIKPILWQYNATWSQRFYIYEQSDGYYNIKVVAYSQLVFESYSNGSTIGLQEPNSSSIGIEQQRFTINIEQEEAVNSEVITNKWVEEIAEDKFKLSIEAYVEGSSKIKPTDIVIVVDQSSSMLHADGYTGMTTYNLPNTNEGGFTRAQLENDSYWQNFASHGLALLTTDDDSVCFLMYRELDGNKRWFYYDTGVSKNTWWDGELENLSWSVIHNRANFYNVSAANWTKFENNGIFATRYGYMYWALIDFVEQMELVDADNRIAIIGFAGEGEASTEVLCHLQYVNTTKGKEIVKAAVDDILCSGLQTHHDAGLKLANDIYADEMNLPDKRDRKIIFFTDGQDSRVLSDVTQAESDAIHNMALEEAYLAKSNGTTVFSIGMLKSTEDIMTYISSTYPDARAMNDLGSRVEKSYFYRANNADELLGVFEDINDVIASTSVKLSETAYIKDIVTQYFTITSGASSVSAYVIDCIGFSDSTPLWSSNKVPLQGTVTVNENVVEVKGFNFSENFITPHSRVQDSVTNFYGQKLLVEIEIVPKDSFVGGNQVATNEPTSGLYNEIGDMVSKLPEPEVDVSIVKIELQIPELYSYYGSSFLQHLTLNKIQQPVTLWRGDYPIKLDLTKSDFGLGDWQLDYSNVTLVLLDSNGNVLSDGIRDIRTDTVYSMRITITPKYSGDYVQEAESLQNDIHVFYPELTFKDQYFWYGESVPTSDTLQGAKVCLKWRNLDGYYTTAPIFNTSNTVISGDEPIVTFVCSPVTSEASLPKVDVPVQVTVSKIGYIYSNYEHYTYFAWEECSPVCEQRVVSHTQDSTLPEFYLHINTCSLTITKIGGDSTEPYVFDIMKDGVFYTQATVCGNNSVTIYELPIGEYTVFEDMKLSWRYTSEMSDDGIILLNRTNNYGKVSCTNTLKDKKWLNDYDLIANIPGEVNQRKKESDDEQ